MANSAILDIEAFDIEIAHGIDLSEGHSAVNHLNLYIYR